jgi:hypothetical protein
MNVSLFGARCGMIRKKPAPDTDPGWKPVFRKRSCPSKNLERQSIQFELIAL